MIPRVFARNPVERTAAAVDFICGRASRVRRRGRSTASRYPAERVNSRQRNILLLASAMALVVLIGAWALWRATPPTQFSAHAWRNTPEDKREAMARDFIANHFRKGMTRAELIVLLGNSDPGFPQELQYIVGTVMIDYRVLWVRVDEDGKAVSATIYQTS
jgi:hypothetical protein